MSVEINQTIVMQLTEYIPIICVQAISVDMHIRPKRKLTAYGWMTMTCQQTKRKGALHH